MSSEELSRPGPPTIPNGFYNLKYGDNVGVGGMYMTAGIPRSEVTVEALRPQPPGKTQIMIITYNTQAKAYTLVSSTQRQGIAYVRPVNRSPIIVSPGAPSFFDILPVREPGKPILYRITIGGGPTQELAIGISPSQLSPPRLDLQPLSPTNVWQLRRLIPNAAGEVEEQFEEDVDEEFNDEE